MSLESYIEEDNEKGNMYTAKDFNEMVDIFKRHIPTIRALYLFGSYAQGVASAESDVDIAVIVDKPLEWAERTELLNALWNDLGRKKYIVDIIIKQTADFENDKDLPVTLSHTIASEGKILWKKAA